MTEDEVKKAIEKGKLPLSIVERIEIIFFVILFIVGTPILYQNNHSLYKVLMFILFIGVILGFRVYNIFQAKKLFRYSSTITLERKKEILDKLIDDPNIRYSDEFILDNYYSFSERTFSVIILYDDSGYYVNSTLSLGRMGGELASPKMTEIIRRIQKLEAEL